MIGYSYIDTTPLPLPVPRENNGWFTGQPAKNMSYAHIPLTPEAHIMIEKTKESNGPKNAVAHIPSTTRPGNNQITTTYHQEYDLKNYNLRCIYRS